MTGTDLILNNSTGFTEEEGPKDGFGFMGISESQIRPYRWWTLKR